MSFVSVTRLRLRSARFLPGFMVHAIRSRRQAARSDGFLGGALLADRAFAFWTATVWRDEAAMNAYMAAGAHRAAMPRLASWCDEASVTHWTDQATVPPDWHVADRRMRAEGRPSRVRDPSPRHAGLDYEPPRITLSIPLRPVRRRS